MTIESARAIFLAPEAGPPGSSLVETLRIVLAGVARLEERRLDPPTGGDRPTAVAARELVTGVQRAVDVVLWIVPVTGETFTLYALTRSRPDAVIEVGQAELGKSADIDRTIALKLRNVLEGLLSRAAASVSAAPTVAATQPPVTRARWPQAIWRLGLVGAAGVGTNARAEAGLGARFHAGGLRWEASALVALATTIELGNDPAVEASEWDFGFRFTGLHAAGPRLAVGGLVEAGARRLFAQASLPNGAINQARVLVPVLWSGPEIRWSLGGRMEICAAAGVEVALQRQRFSIAGVPVADMGRVRFLSLVALVALL